MSEAVTIGDYTPLSELGWNFDNGCYVFYYENYLSPGADLFYWIETDEGLKAFVAIGAGEIPDHFHVEVPPDWQIIGTSSHTAEDEGETYTIRACPLALT